MTNEEIQKKLKELERRIADLEKQSKQPLIVKNLTETYHQNNW